MLHKTYPGKWIFSPEAFTDQNPVIIIEEAVRSKLLEHLPEEMPYTLNVELEYLDMDNEGKNIIFLFRHLVLGKKVISPIQILLHN